MKVKVTIGRASASELRCLLGGAQFGSFICQLRNALIGSSSPVSRASSSSNYILFSSLMFLVLCLLAFLFLLWLGCAVGYRPHTPTSTLFNTPLPGYVAACKISGLKGKHIGVPRDYLEFAEPRMEPIFSVFEAAIEIIKKAGDTVVDNPNLSAYSLDQDLNGNSSTVVPETNFFTNLPQCLSQLTINPQKVYTLTDLRNFTSTFPAEAYPDRDTQIFDEAVNLCFSNTSPEFRAAYQANLEISGPRGILGLLANFTLDALIQPTAFSFGLPALSGLPVVSVPLGFLPYNTPVVKEKRGTLITNGPNIPSVLIVPIIRCEDSTLRHLH